MGEHVYRYWLAWSSRDDSEDTIPFESTHATRAAAVAACEQWLSGVTLRVPTWLDLDDARPCWIRPASWPEDARVECRLVRERVVDDGELVWRVADVEVRPYTVAVIPEVRVEGEPYRAERSERVWCGEWEPAIQAPGWGARGVMTVDWRSGEALTRLAWLLPAPEELR
jgi:hypothetical protein